MCSPRQAGPPGSGETLVAKALAQPLLVVRSSAAASDETAQVLARWGFDRVRASGPDRALAVALKDSPALAVVDLQAPGRGGPGVAEDLRRELALPLVVLTSDLRPPAIARLVALRPASTLATPVSDLQLWAAVISALVTLPWISLADALTPRQLEVSRWLTAGHRLPAIARRLGVSDHTVRNHVKSIFRKLGVGSQVELLARVLGPMSPVRGDQPLTKATPGATRSRR
jgi:DNA-binding NarL/FixJ family response regulator